MYVIMDPNGEEFVRTFYEKEFQKTNQEEFRIEKEINFILNGKVMIIHSIVGLIKRYCIKMSQYFPEP